jgi:HK97 family phage major capsid protein
MGSFVPRDFFAGVKAAMKWIDPLVDPDVCTVVETENGRILQVGFYDDTNSYASVVGENTNQAANETDIASVSEVDVQAFSYRTPLWRLSVEAFSDLDQMTTAIDLFGKFSAQRVARGVGRDLMTGNGSGKPLGLIPSLMVSGAPYVVATGSSESTGQGAQTGVNSIGYSDMCNCMENLNEAFLKSSKCAWLMNQSTRSSIGKILDHSGRPLMQFDSSTGRYWILGKPVIIAPSMANIGSAAIPVVLGDLSYWISRHATAGDRVQVVKETVGLIEKGEVGLRTWQRWDGALLYSAAVSGTCPMTYIMNHS